MTQTNQFLSEAGHFYQPDGTPAYEIVGKNGRKRKTTLRDAKEYGLWPSVTTILGVLDKPGLNRWRENIIVEHTDGTTRLEGESTYSYIGRIMAKAGEKRKEAAERGTRIHAYLERAFAGETMDYPEDSEEAKVIESVFTAVNAITGGEAHSCEPEVCCPNATERYAGKADLIHRKQQIVFDFKTKEFVSEDRAPTGYPEQAMQLAAYGAALGFTSSEMRLINIFVSSTEPGLVEVYEHDKPSKWKRAFECLARYWWTVKGDDNGAD